VAAPDAREARDLSRRGIDAGTSGNRRGRAPKRQLGHPRGHPGPPSERGSPGGVADPGLDNEERGPTATIGWLPAARRRAFGKTLEGSAWGSLAPRGG